LLARWSERCSTSTRHGACVQRSSRGKRIIPEHALSHEYGPTWYRYRGKGGKTGKRELPQPAYAAIVAGLAAFGHDIATVPAEAPLWPFSGRTGALTSGTFYANLQRYLRHAGLPPSGVHIFRHSAAKLRRDAGESIEDVSRFLDHSSLAVTTTYLRRLEGQEDRSWAKVAEAIGVVLP
jgi:integrase